MIYPSFIQSKSHDVLFNLEFGLARESPFFGAAQIRRTTALGTSPTLDDLGWVVNPVVVFAANGKITINITIYIYHQQKMTQFCGLKKTDYG